MLIGKSMWEGKMVSGEAHSEISFLIMEYMFFS